MSCQELFRGEAANVTVPSKEESYRYTAENAGTKPYPDKKGRMESVAVKAGTDGAGYKSYSPGINDSPAGTSPGVQEHFREEQTGISAVPDGAGYQVPKPDNAGTNPIPAIQFSERNTDIRTGTESGEYKYTSFKTDKSPAGTIPGTSEQFSDGPVNIHSGAEGDGYIATPTRVTGSRAKAEAEKTIGGVSPVVEGESYEVQYPICGTEMTKK